MLASNKICALEAMAKTLICSSVVMTSEVPPGTKPCWSALPGSCSVPADDREMEFQFAVS